MSGGFVLDVGFSIRCAIILAMDLDLYTDVVLYWGVLDLHYWALFAIMQKS